MPSSPIEIPAISWAVTYGAPSRRRTKKRSMGRARRRMPDVSTRLTTRHRTGLSMAHLDHGLRRPPRLTDAYLLGVHSLTGLTQRLFRSG
jgi:hypothetical protein